MSCDKTEVLTSAPKKSVYLRFYFKEDNISMIYQKKFKYTIEKYQTNLG